jgi:hypothetical protein
MNYKKLTILVFETLFLFLSAICFPLCIYADGTSLTLSPSVIRIQAKPPADIWTPFSITNNSNQEVSLQIGYKTFDPEQSSNGRVVFLNDTQSIPGSDQKIFEKMQIVDDQNVSHDMIIVGPKQKLNFRLRITLPANEPNSDYYFSLIFLQKNAIIDQNSSIDNNSNQKSSSVLQAGIGLNVLLAVGDRETPMGSIDNFSTPLFANGNSVSFSLSVYNAGTHFINPTGAILIKNMFGQTVGKITVPSSIILSGTTRKYSDNTNTQDTTYSSGLLWRKNFLFGVYSATITLHMSSDGPVYIRRIRYIAFPLFLFIQLLVILCILAYVYVRVKRKIS